MSDAAKGQVNTSAAEVYESFFLPALFAQWAQPMADAAGVAAGHHALDVACGTGVLARALADRVAPGGSVVGVDVNPGMLAVAARQAPHIAWREAPAEALPFADATFDRVLSQFGLMFFADRAGALAEMLRVLKPGGRLAVAVWSDVAHSPGYEAMIALLERLFGAEAADALRAPFCLGDVGALRALFAEAGAPQAEVRTVPGTARFDSVDAWVHTDVKGWTLADMIDDDQYARLRDAAPEALAPFVGADGRVAFAAPAHVVTVTGK